MDEMKVKRHVDVISGEEYGYIDIGKGVDCDSTPEAENVLVFMLVCVNGNWKIPLSNYFVNALRGKDKADIVIKNLSELKETGVEVTSITFD